MADTTHQSSGETPVIVAVGGLDSSGGAGLVRDYLTSQELAAQVCLISTAWTLQLESGVVRVDPRAPDQMQQDLRAALESGRGRALAVKIGMVAGETQVPALVEALRGFAGPVVFDPVLTASHGGSLYRGDPRALLPLLRRASLVTPNLEEAAVLSGRPTASVEAARAAAGALVDGGIPAVLVKGGHLAGNADDLLVWRDSGTSSERLYPAPRLPGRSPRGTGCALATAIAVGLARGQPLDLAVLDAKTWLHARIAAAREVAGERHL